MCRVADWCDRPCHASGPRGRRFESCLPDSEGRDSTRETEGTRPSSFPGGALRTAGAPKSTTLGADGAASTLRKVVGRPVRADDVELPSAIPAFLEACAKMAADAARSADVGTARGLLALAARATAL